MENSITVLEKGMIHFKWKGGKTVSLECVVENGEKIDHDSIQICGMGELESVTVEYKGEKHPLCLECQNHIVKARTIDNDGRMEDSLECTNPDCPNKTWR